MAAERCDTKTTPRAVARVAALELAFGAGGFIGALLLLLYIHGELQPWWALLCAGLSAIVLRRVVATGYTGFPRFLRLPLDTGVSLIGLLIASATTMVMYPLAYWALKLPQVILFPVVVVALGLGIASVVYTHGRLAREIEKQEARLAALKQEELRARLSALQAQINPHFLFNALNTLAELVHADPDHADEFVGDLAHLLRYSLRSSAVDQVPLAQELEAVERYLRLEKVRLGDRLSVELVIADEVREIPVPGLTVEPLVENAVKHAISPRAEGGTIRVEAGLVDGQLQIVVADDGPGLPAEVLERLERCAGGAPLADGVDSAGTGGAGGGLASAQQRIVLAYEGAATMNVESSAEGGTRVELRIPR